MGQLMEYKGYHTAVTYDSDDNILVGKLVGIQDIIGFHANSIKEFKEIFERTVDDYIDYCKEIGKEPNKEYKGVFNVRISPALHRQLAIRAEENGESLNAAVTHAISKYVSV